MANIYSPFLPYFFGSTFFDTLYNILYVSLFLYYILFRRRKRFFMDEKNKKITEYDVDYTALYDNSCLKQQSFNDVTIIESEDVDRPAKNKKLNKTSTFQHFTKFLLKKVPKTLFTSLIITVFIVLVISVFGFFLEFDEKRLLSDYDRFIFPVVMQNPAPFSPDSPPNNQLMLKSGIDDVYMNSNSDVLPFDPDGRQIILGQDVRNSISKLFNYDVPFDDATLSTVSSCSYDPSSDIFFIEPIHNHFFFSPHTIKSESIDKNLTKLTVEYLVSDLSFFELQSDKLNKKSVEKTMTYFLKDCTDSKNKYIFKVDQYE